LCSSLSSLRSQEWDGVVDSVATIKATLGVILEQSAETIAKRWMEQPAGSVNSKSGF
jgi:hypothetical protein